MGRIGSADWQHVVNGGSKGRYEGRQGLIAKAARACFERRGVEKTSIADIMREVNITRELFYYYYPNKRTVVEAVLDSFVRDARTMMRKSLMLEEPAGERDVGSAADAGEAPDGRAAKQASASALVVQALRKWLATDASARLPMTEILRETGSLPQVLCRVANEAISALRDSGEIDVRTDVDGLREMLIGAMVLHLTTPELENDRLVTPMLCAL